MLTRLKVSGFKNLVDVDVRFGAFTCIAGANGVGKSNLFDAIRFLSALSQMPLTEAALSIRDGSGKQSDIRNLFHRVGDRYVDKMSFEAEMIIPKEGINEFGKTVQTTSSFLKYSLEIGNVNSKANFPQQLKIVKEELVDLDSTQLQKSILFKNQYKDWSNFIISKNVSYSFINTDRQGEIFINGYILNDDDTVQYTKIVTRSNNLKATALCLSSKVFSDEHTHTLARLEMMNWQLLQLEPSALRKSNEFTTSSQLNTNGSNLAASFYYLVERYDRLETANGKHKAKEIEAKVYARASNRLAELIDDVDEVWVDRDEKRELFTLMVRDKYGTVYPARSLSDGTLRFLALTVLELDPDSPRLLCLEEPENAIYPDRVPEILELLQDIAVDLEEPIDFDNPLRQVIINTHSPVVVQQVPEDSLLIADLEENIVDGQRFKQACFRYLADTWRDTNSVENNNKSRLISKGDLLSFLNPVSRQFEENRVVDRDDLQSLMPGN